MHIFLICPPFQNLGLKVVPSRKAIVSKGGHTSIFLRLPLSRNLRYLHLLKAYQEKKVQNNSFKKFVLFSTHKVSQFLKNIYKKGEMQA